MSIANLYSPIRPSLSLDFVNSRTVDPRITFTRASTATYYDGKTFAKAEENLLVRSQEFDNAAWGKQNATVTANTSVAPDGTLTADTLVENSSNFVHGLNYPSFGVGAGTHTLSVFAKDSGRFLVLAISCGPLGASNFVSAVFDLTTGTVANSNQTGSQTLVGASIVDAGGGWYRCIVTGTMTTTVDLNISLSNVSTAPTANFGRLAYAGNGTSGAILWGAQFETRSTVTAYTPTTDQPITRYVPQLMTAAANTPRIDFDPVTGACRGLLIEEPRTNLLTYSEQFDNAAWSSIGATVSANQTLAPDGTITADKLAETAVTTNHAIFRTVSGSAGVAYTLSFYLKAAERGFARVGITDGNVDYAVRVNLSTGAITLTDAGITGVVTNAGNGWYRLAVTRTVASASFNTFAGINLDATGTGVYTGSAGSGIYIWGAQLEVGVFPTSYIPTTSSQVTRSADSAVMTGANFSSWFRAGEGTLYTEITPRALAASSGIVLNDNTTNNRIRLATASVSDQGTVTVGDTAQATLDGGTPAANTTMKLAMAYKLNDFALSLNGAAVAVDTLGTVPVVTQLQIGAETTTVGNLHIRKAAFYPARLSNATLQALTT